MNVIDPGHTYALDVLDSPHPAEQVLEFVKREGKGYPGNVGHHPGTNMQEVLRALIDRVRYLDDQIPYVMNEDAISHMRAALYAFEVRAAERHGRSGEFFERFNPTMIEIYPTCKKCGHVGCDGMCH